MPPSTGYFPDCCDNNIIYLSLQHSKSSTLNILKMQEPVFDSHRWARHSEAKVPPSTKYFSDCCDNNRNDDARVIVHFVREKKQDTYQS